MTGSTVSGGTWTFFSMKPGCTLMCRVLPVVPTVRPAKWMFHGRAKTVDLLRCLNPLHCPYARSCQVRQAAALLRCSDKQLWLRIEHYVTEARALDDMSKVENIGIDETNLRKGQNYITVVHDLDEKRLVFGCEGRDHQTVGEFGDDLEAQGGKREQNQTMSAKI